MNHNYNIHKDNIDSKNRTPLSSSTDELKDKSVVTSEDNALKKEMKQTTSTTTENGKKSFLEKLKLARRYSKNNQNNNEYREMDFLDNLDIYSKEKESDLINKKQKLRVNKIRTLLALDDKKHQLIPSKTTDFSTKSTHFSENELYSELMKRKRVIFSYIDVLKAAFKEKLNLNLEIKDKVINKAIEVTDSYMSIENIFKNNIDIIKIKDFLNVVNYKFMLNKKKYQSDFKRILSNKNTLEKNFEDLKEEKFINPLYNKNETLLMNGDIDEEKFLSNFGNYFKLVETPSINIHEEHSLALLERIQNYSCIVKEFIKNEDNNEEKQLQKIPELYTPEDAACNCYCNDIYKPDMNLLKTLITISYKGKKENVELPELLESIKEIENNTEMNIIGKILLDNYLGNYL